MVCIKLDQLGFTRSLTSVNMLAVSKYAIYGYVFVDVANKNTLYGFAMDTYE